MCCNTGIPWRRQRTWHSTPSQLTDTGRDTPPSHSIQTQDITPNPVTVNRHMADLSLWYILIIDVERHTWKHNNPILYLGSNPIGKSFPDLPRHAAQFHDAIMVVSQKLGRKCTVPSESWPRDLWRVFCLNGRCNEEQIITGYPIDGTMGSSGGGRVRKLSMLFT